MVQPEKRLLWHPRGSSKFVVGGHSQIALYEYEHGTSQSSVPEIRHVTSRHDLHYMKVCTSELPFFDFCRIMASLEINRINFTTVLRLVSRSSI